MRTEKEYKDAIKIIKRLIKYYPYIAEECRNNNGNPCSHCQAILDAKILIAKN
jgi:hypothetical protein